jgi:hypothetical protein
MSTKNHDQETNKVIMTKKNKKGDNDEHYEPWPKDQ